MTDRKIILEPEDSFRREPHPPETRRFDFREAAGGTTADCAAVACLGPLVVANILGVVVYKVPRVICRRARMSLRRRRLTRRREVAPRRSPCRCGCDETDLQIHSVGSDFGYPDLDSELEKVEEEDMWASFDGLGFWRSPSRVEFDVRS